MEVGKILNVKITKKHNIIVESIVFGVAVINSGIPDVVWMHAYHYYGWEGVGKLIYVKIMKNNEYYFESIVFLGNWDK